LKFTVMQNPIDLRVRMVEVRLGCGRQKSFCCFSHCSQTLPGLPDQVSIFLRSVFFGQQCDTEPIRLYAHRLAIGLNHPFTRKGQAKFMDGCGGFSVEGSGSGAELRDVLLQIDLFRGRLRISGQAPKPRRK